MGYQQAAGKAELAAIAHRKRGSKTERAGACGSTKSNRRTSGNPDSEQRLDKQAQLTQAVQTCSRWPAADTAMHPWHGERPVTAALRANRNEAFLVCDCSTSSR